MKGVSDSAIKHKAKVEHNGIYCLQLRTDLYEENYGCWWWNG
jgi:hypothetical protein